MNYYIFFILIIIVALAGCGSGIVATGKAITNTTPVTSVSGLEFALLAGQRLPFPDYREYKGVQANNHYLYEFAGETHSLKRIYRASTNELPRVQIKPERFKEIAHVAVQTGSTTTEYAGHFGEWHYLLQFTPIPGYGDRLSAVYATHYQLLHPGYVSSNPMPHRPPTKRGDPPSILAPESVRALLYEQLTREVNRKPIDEAAINIPSAFQNY